MYFETEMELDSAMHSGAVIERVLRCIWRARWSNSQMHLDAEIKLNSEMRLEAAIKLVWRCIWRPRSG